MHEPSLLDRYEKLLKEQFILQQRLKEMSNQSTENEQLLGVINYIHAVLDAKDTDIDTVRALFSEISPLTTTSKKRKDSLSRDGDDETVSNHKRIRHDEMVAKKCYACNTVKPIAKFQRMRRKSNGLPYTYTNPTKCNRCNKKA
jgi:hypothetical protein